MSSEELIESLKLGKGKIYDIKLEYNGKTYDIPVRKLSNKEIQNVRRLEGKHMKFKGTINDRKANFKMHKLLSVSDLSEDTFEAAILAISLSMSVNNFNISKEQVEELFTPRLIEEFYEEIKELNEFTQEDEEQMKNFREDE